MYTEMCTKRGISISCRWVPAALPCSRLQGAAHKPTRHDVPCHVQPHLYTHRLPSGSLLQYMAGAKQPPGTGSRVAGLDMHHRPPHPAPACKPRPCKAPLRRPRRCGGAGSAARRPPPSAHRTACRMRAPTLRSPPQAPAAVRRCRKRSTASSTQRPQNSSERVSAPGRPGRLGKGASAAAAARRSRCWLAICAPHKA